MVNGFSHGRHIEDGGFAEDGGYVGARAPIYG